MTDGGADTSFDDSEVPVYADLLRLDGRGVLVAGAGQGIGRQVAHALAEVGARVLCLDYDQALAERIAAEVGGVAHVADVRSRDDIAGAVDRAVAEFGRLDTIVDIVGMARYRPLLDVSDDDWTWTFEMVLRHGFLLTQLGAQAMEDGGAMAFVASVSGITSAPLHAPYGAAKAGLMSLVRSAAVELGPRGIRVNAVAPGFVWTPRVSELVGDRGREANVANTPLRAIAEPSDIARVLLFLVSDLARHITGQTVVVDGGVSAKFPYPMDL
ncbi:MAG: SDR family oxidoreductase [Actinobacteria bacterium]|nr:SDR family oxidoreductase [Actinomycetota bacterium]